MSDERERLQAEQQADMRRPQMSTAMQARPVGGLISIEQQRAIAEIQAELIVARSMPRDPVIARDLILQDCTDPNLAEEASYEYARGGTDISGASIRVLEVIARRWGNFKSGIKELSRESGISICQAYAVDLESNTRDEKIFQVRHWRDTKLGGYQLTDERDIYELIANMGARRKRSCMEAVIPKEIVNAAVAQCHLTLKTQIDINAEWIKQMLERFAAYGVTKDMIERRIQRHVEAITPALAVQLRRIFNSLKDGMSSPNEWFELSLSGQPGKKTEALGEKLKTRARTKKAEPPPQEKPPPMQANGSGPADPHAVSVQEPTKAGSADTVPASVAAPPPSDMEIYLKELCERIERAGLPAMQDLILEIERIKDIGQRKSAASVWNARLGALKKPAARTAEEEPKLL